MIIDLENYSESNDTAYDLCIVGTGAASLAMISELFDTDLKVLVLEAGGDEITDRNQAIYDTINHPHPFPGAQEGRFRVFGGTTTKWGGQSLHLEPEDFLKRDWVPNSGWPINYDDVARYYPKVDELLNLHPNDYKSDIFGLLKKKPLTKSDKLTLKFSKWSPLPNLRENFRKRLETSLNITVLKNANLTSINLNDQFDAVSSLTVSDFKWNKVSVTAKNYILACGGIENARLLLVSNNQLPAGVGNGNDLVGRYLQEHPNAHVATLAAKGKDAQHYFNYFYIGKTRFLPRFVFSDKFQQENKILNCSAYFSFVTDDSDSFSIAKELYRKYARKALSRKDIGYGLGIFKNIPDLFKIAGEYIFHKRVYTPKAVLKLNLMTEATPDKDNRIILSNMVDALGMPKAVVAWHSDELLLHTFRKCTEYLKTYFDQLNLGELVTDDWMYADDWFTQIKDAKHHIGTTRMGATAETGVVDVNCKIHGLQNLYIAGSSVFPTSGHSNPTSTLLALAYRLVDHLKTKRND